MTAIEKRYRFRVAHAGASTVAGNVDWTETADISEVGPVGGQRVEALSSTTSARPWSVVIADVAEDITARLADADGRAQLLRRLADISVSTDGGSSYTVLATGRIDAVEMAGVAAFRFAVTDERLVERTTTIFTVGNTTRLAPRGFLSAWRTFQPGPVPVFIVDEVDTVNNKTTYGAAGDLPIYDDALDLMESDVVDNPALNQGNFETLRVNILGSGREIERINGSPARDPVAQLRGRPDGRLVGSFIVAGLQDTADARREVWFEMPERDPTEALPLHIGGQAGVDPFTLVKNIYDGDYQASADPATVRYDSDVFSAFDASTNPRGLIGRFSPMHFRIEGPENMAAWLEKNIYGPLGVVPIINADGEVAPVYARMPDSTEIADPDDLFEFNASNSATVPRWLNQGREQVSVCKINFTYARLAEQGNDEPSLDGLVSVTRTVMREHDNVADVGRVVHEVDVTGMHDPLDRGTFARSVAVGVFDRFGDGPIYTTIKGLSATEEVMQGDWVLIDFDTYPALQNQSRSGKRLAQVMVRTDDMDGPTFELLEAGPNSQPLSAPTLALASNSDDPVNSISVTVSGLNAGEGYELHIAESGTEPAESSSEWQYRVLRGDGNETITVPRIPSGSTFWGRVRATQSGRVSSDWSTADSQATTALTAPSGVADSDVTADAATITWTLGETEYGHKIDLDGTYVALLSPGIDEYRYENLDASTGYTAGVTCVDRHGGESTRATDSFTTDAVEETLLVPNAVVVLVGGAP
jgi:hypothetical protein